MTDQSPPARAAAGRRLVGIAEVADYLGVSDRVVRDYIATGVLAAYRLAGRKLIRLDLNEVDERLLLRIPTVGQGHS